MLRFVRWGSRRRPRAPKSNVQAHRHIKCLGAFIAGVVALLAMAPEAHATCRGRNFVERMSLSVSGTVRATSSDGETYDNIRAGDFHGDYSITLCGDGALDGVIVHLGTCSGHDRGGCTSNPIMYLEFPRARSLSKKTPTFTFAPTPNSVAGQSIIKTCNAHADEQRGAARDKEIFPGFFSVTLGVDTRRDTGALGGGRSIGHVASGVVDPADHRPLDEYSKTEPGTLTLKILCAPLPAPIKAPPKITGAQLGVATFGDTCPKPAAATVMINAEAPRPVFYKIERGNGTTTTDDWIQGEIKLGKAPDGRQRPFLAAQHKLPELDPGTRKFRLWIDTWGKTPWREVEVDCPQFKVTSAWLKYKVEDQATCPKQVVETATFHTNRPGNVPYEIKHDGGLVVSKGKVKAERQGDQYVATAVRKLTLSHVDAQFMADVKNSPANSGWVPLKIDCLEALSGMLTLKSRGSTSCEGEALVAIHTSQPGELPYELECGPGRSWQRAVTAPANKIGVDKVRFDVKNNEQVTCVLRTRIAGKLKSLDGASETFQCHKPSGAAGSGDLVPETGPDSSGPRPPRVVADPPKACPKGTVGKWPRCRKRSCPRGTEGEWPDCKRIQKECPRGTVGRWPNCRKQVCPRGTKGEWPNCRAIKRECPHGTVGRWPNCKKAGCPPGRVRVRGRCIEPAR